MLALGDPAKEIRGMAQSNETTTKSASAKEAKEATAATKDSGRVKIGGGSIRFTDPGRVKIGGGSIRF
jgi:hypothetical protein